MLRPILSIVSFVASAFLFTCTTAIADTTAPVVTSVTVSPPMVAPEDNVSVTVTATDNTAVSQVTADGVNLEHGGGNTWTGSIPANDIYGVHTVTVVARDAADNITTDVSKSYHTAQIVGIVNRNALRQPTNTGRDRFLYKVWGKVDVISPNSFSVNDGSGLNTVVLFPGHDACNGDFVIARGILDPSNVPAVLSYAKYQIAAQSARTPINLSPANLTIGKDLQTTLQGSLVQAAPAGNLKVTITSLNPDLVLLSNTSTSALSDQLVVQVNAGSTSLPSIYVNALASSGVAKIAVTAPGCQGSEATVTLTPSGFVPNSSSFSTTTFSANQQANVASYRLNPSTLAHVATQSLRSGMSVQVGLTSSDTNVGTIVTSPLTVSGGTSTASFYFDPANAGTSTLSVVQPAGFTASSSLNQITATVTAPNINAGTAVIGKDLQLQLGISTSATPPVATDFSVVIADPTIAVLSKSPTTSGSQSVTFEGITSTTVGSLYIHALKLGETNFSVTAPGFNAVTRTVTVVPSGFVIDSPASINTTSFSANTNLSIKAYRLNPDTLAVVGTQGLRAGISPVTLTPVLSNELIGTLVSVPAVFQAGEISKTFSFDPSGAGSGTITVQQPSGFTAAVNQNSIPVNVTAPGTTINAAIVGKDLQVLASQSLGASPPSPVTVTISVDDPTTAVVSKTATDPGSASISYENVTSMSLPNFYVQGLKLGQTTLRISAPGYNPNSATATVMPSGFIIETSSVSTTTLSPNSNISVRPYRLSNSMVATSIQNLRPGATATINLTLSNPVIGSISPSSVTFGTNDSSKLVQFDPAAVGTGTVAINTPTGFSTPTTGQSMPVTVSTPTISLNDQTVGRDLQISVTPTLQTAPQSATDFTIVSSDPASLLISTSPTTVGTGSVTRTGITSNSVGTLYLQALALGVVQLTISGAGYETKLVNITVNPSGFVIESPSSITTKTATSTVKISAALLNSVTLNYSNTQQVRAGKSVSIPVTIGNPSIGSVNPVNAAFTGGDAFKQLTFTPASVGTSTLSITNPIEFSTPSNLQSIPVTVNP